MLQFNAHNSPAATNPQTFADLEVGDLFVRTNIKGYKQGAQPRTLYMVTEDSDGNAVATIYGTYNGANLDPGDVIGASSNYVTGSTKVRRLGNINDIGSFNWAAAAAA